MGGVTDRARSIAEIRSALALATGIELEALIATLRDDHRAGVRSLLASTRARLARGQRESARLDRLMDVQRTLIERGLLLVAGIDEVGRGALAGPVTAGAVVLHIDTRIDGLNDSKLLSPAARDRVAASVRLNAHAWSVAHASAREIDSIGIGPATRLAWARALEGLGIAVDHVLVDGNDARGLPVASTPIVRGDSSVGAIAAASVIAKVARDAIMVAFADEYPGYEFELNKGYGAADHMDRLLRVGPSAIHRLSFAPCSERDRPL